MKFRVTVTYEYEVDEKDAQIDYDTQNPVEMAAIDEANFRTLPADSTLVGDLRKLPFEVSVEVVQ